MMMMLFALSLAESGAAVAVRRNCCQRSLEPALPMGSNFVSPRGYACRGYHR